ncbi:MAG: sterol desaturase family protein [Bacteroidia bacterium]
MLNSYPLVIPVFLLIVFIEWYISNKKQDNKYTAGNFTMNLTIGAIDQIGSLFYFTLMYFVLKYVYLHYRIIEMKDSWYQWVLAYVAVDFLSYWYHRLSHRVNILWAGHITHHSSELFNFSNGFRTSPFQGINRIIFWAFLPVFGFSPVVLVFTFKLSGLYDFLVHTEYAPKLEFIEKIFITPSLHSVHHGKNDIYIDKNYGSTFSIWDRLFGTFQKKTETVKYGIKGGYIDKSAFWAIGYYYHYLWKTIIVTTPWHHKIKLLFMPPEWKPAAENAAAPRLQKNKVPVSLYLKRYAVFQLSCCIAGIIALLACKNFVSNWEFTLCAFIGVMIMSNVIFIFNENINVSFVKDELIRLTLAAVLVFTTMLACSHFYLVYVLIFLLSALITIVIKRTI